MLDKILYWFNGLFTKKKTKQNGLVCSKLVFYNPHTNELIEFPSDIFNQSDYNINDKELIKERLSKATNEKEINYLLDKFIEIK